MLAVWVPNFESDIPKSPSVEEASEVVTLRPTAFVGPDTKDREPEKLRLKTEKLRAGGP